MLLENIELGVKSDNVRGKKLEEGTEVGIPLKNDGVGTEVETPLGTAAGT